ncbi:hypothetical protein NHX12_008853 [Muraenolepis orangiensis]|uniref:Guided entry of tail-anchored proteins factor 1 n=1 Tax=Muraenolepis orangiensis TaxID=630683 RepID=A0A9Q0IA79_9TELE|nr:hypothetical protein NHX12_008853 [Muraenolepis orangiensis]
MAAGGLAWVLVLLAVFMCNFMKILLPTLSSFLSRVVQKDAQQESEMRAELQEMKKEHSSISMMDEFARYARLERKINKMTDKLKTHVKSRTAQQAKMKWVVNIGFYILQAVLMVSLIWKYYAEPVTVLPSKWIAPVERLVAFPSGVMEAGGDRWRESEERPRSQSRSAPVWPEASVTEPQRPRVARGLGHRAAAPPCGRRPRSQSRSAPVWPEASVTEPQRPRVARGLGHRAAAPSCGQAASSGL